MKSFTRLLIANRGEIAARVARTARKLGLWPIVVYSEADRDTLAVREILEGASGEVHLLGPGPANESYLDVERVLAIAKRAKAEAVHPGYGFLSEESSFARAVIAAGLVWVGPSPEAMDRVASKSRAKELAESAGVPTLQGLRGTQEISAFVSAAEKVGYPVLLKAAAGGGGRGIRKVTSRRELEDQFGLARTEAQRAFANGELLLEKFVERVHHVEVQIFGDDSGQVIHLGERDCSTQRRHQKIIEEAPSAVVSAELRKRLCEAAVTIGRAAKYTGAGTVEFLVAGGDFHFLEVNTRLQVEHPVTEALTGLDFVELQLRVARGEKLPPQDQIKTSGHAIELRLCAEDPEAQFRPSTGRIRTFSFPRFARVDHFLTPQTIITPYYDSMIAKIIVHGSTRMEAVAMAVKALDETFVTGLVTNRSYLRRILTSAPFAASQVTTRTLDETKLGQVTQTDPSLEAIAALASFVRRQSHGDEALRGWSNSGPRMSLVITRSEDGKAKRWQASRSEGTITVAASDGGAVLTAQNVESKGHLLTFEGQNAFVEFNGGELHLLANGEEATFLDGLARRRGAGLDIDPNLVLAPMDGIVTKVLTEKGASVQKGQTLAVLEAMKIQLELKSPRDGVIDDVLARSGTQVRNRQTLVKLK